MSLSDSVTFSQASVESTQCELRKEKKYSFTDAIFISLSHRGCHSSLPKENETWKPETRKSLDIKIIPQ